MRSVLLGRRGRIMAVRAMLDGVSGGTATNGATEIACRFAARFGGPREGQHVWADVAELVIAGGAKDLVGSMLEAAWLNGIEANARIRVPEEIGLETKPEIALAQIRAAYEVGIPRGAVLMDAGCGSDTRLRAEITALGLTYVAGIMPNTSVWAPGTAPPPPRHRSGKGRPPKLISRDARHRWPSVKALALGRPAKAWRSIIWREGTKNGLTSPYARVRVAHRYYQGTESRPEEGLLIEWPRGEFEPTKYRLPTLPESIGFARLMEFAKLRWRIERKYEKLKPEIGSSNYEGRTWRGFHHHATLCVAAYGLLASERETIHPLASASRPVVQETFRSRRLLTLRRRRFRSDVTCRIPARRCAAASSLRWGTPCLDAPVARRGSRVEDPAMYDAVVRRSSKTR